MEPSEAQEDPLAREPPAEADDTDSDKTWEFEDDAEIGVLTEELPEEPGHSESQTSSSPPLVATGYDAGLMALLTDNSAVTDTVRPNRRPREARQDARRHFITLKHLARRRKANLAEALKNGRRRPKEQIDLGLYGIGMTEEESGLLSEFESGMASSISIDASSCEPEFVGRRRQSLDAAAKCEQMLKQTQVTQTEFQPPSRITCKARPRRFNFRQELADLWTRSDRDETSDDSDTGPRLQTRLASFEKRAQNRKASLRNRRSHTPSEDEKTSSRSRGSHTPREDGNSKRPGSKLASQQQKNKSALDELEELTDRLCLRHKETLRKFRERRSDSQDDGSSIRSASLGASSGVRSRSLSSLGSDIDESLRFNQAYDEREWKGRSCWSFSRQNSDSQSSQAAGSSRQVSDSQSSQTASQVESQLHSSFTEGSLHSESQCSTQENYFSQRRRFLPKQRSRKLSEMERLSLSLSSFPATGSTPASPDLESSQGLADEVGSQMGGPSVTPGS